MSARLSPRSKQLFTEAHVAQYESAVLSPNVATLASNLAVPARKYRYDIYNGGRKETFYPVYVQDLDGFRRELSYAEISAHCSGNAQAPAHVSPTTPHVRMFLGQLPYWMTEDVLQDVVEAMSGKRLLALRADIRKDGSGQKSGAWFADVRPEDQEAFSELNKRLIFNPTGVCLFSDADELRQWLDRRDALILGTQQRVAEKNASRVVGARQKMRKCLSAFVIEAQTPTARGPRGGARHQEVAPIQCPVAL